MRKVRTVSRRAKPTRVRGTVAIGLSILVGLTPFAGASSVEALSPARAATSGNTDDAGAQSAPSELPDTAEPGPSIGEPRPGDEPGAPEPGIGAASAAVEPLALGTVTSPPAGAHFTKTTPGTFTATVPASVAGFTGQVCSVTITALAGAGGNANDTTQATAGNNKNGAGAAATATYPVRPGMSITGHVGQGGRYDGVNYTDSEFARDPAGLTTMLFDRNSSTPHTSRARASGGSPDGGFGGSMPGTWWGNIRHVGAGGGGSSLVSIADEELVMVGGGGGNGGGHSTLIGVGGDGGQVRGPGVAPGVSGTNGADSQWYQTHTNYSSVGRISENLANSGQGARTIFWNNPYVEPNSAFVPGGGGGGRADGPGLGGLHRINGNTNAVIPVAQWTNFPTHSSSLRDQRNSVLHGYDASGRTGGSGGDEAIFFRGEDPQGLRRSIGNPDSGGGGGGGYYGGGGGASTVSYGLSINSNRGVTGAGGGGGASFVSPGAVATPDGTIGAVSRVDSGLGPRARSNSNGADGFVALSYQTCGAAEKSVDLAPMSPTIVDESGSTATAGQLVKYTLTFTGGQSGDYVVDHLDHMGDVLDDADWVGNFRYGTSKTAAPTATSPATPGIRGAFDAGAQVVRVTGTVPAQQVRTISFEVRVKPNFPDRLDNDRGDYVLSNFLGEKGSTPPEECEPDDPYCTTNPILGAAIWEKTDGSGETLAGSAWSLTGPAGPDSRTVDILDCTAAECTGPDTDARPGFFELGALAWGDYVLVETAAPDGYELDPTPHSFAVGNTAGNRVAVDLGRFENHASDGSLSWAKTDPEGDPLAGSTWELRGPNGSDAPARVITDCIADAAESCTGPDIDPRAGHFIVTGLAFGEYTLVETAAPAGYVLDDTPHIVSIGSEEGADIAVDLGDIENVPQPALQIPLTGGLGSDGFLIAGGGLLALLLALALVRAHRARSLLASPADL